MNRDQIQGGRYTSKYNRICALPGCGKPVPVWLPFVVRGRPTTELYCSRECVAQVETPTGGRKRSPRREPDVKLKHPEFGGAGVTYEICDRASCRKPITLARPGRDGRYCSVDCRTAVEIDGEEMTTTESGTTAAATTASPIAQGKPTPKKAAAKKGAAKAAPKKAAAKKGAPAKKAAPKAEDNGLVRPGSNMEKLLKMCQKAKGASLAEMVEATKWESSMVSRTLSNLKHKGIEVTRDDDGRYHAPAA